MHVESIEVISRILSGALMTAHFCVVFVFHKVLLLTFIVYLLKDPSNMEQHYLQTHCYRSFKVTRSVDQQVQVDIGILKIPLMWVYSICRIIVTGLLRSPGQKTNRC